MNIRTKLILSVGILAGMIILLVALSVVNLQILTATEPDSPAAMPGLERALLWISVTGAICILAVSCCWSGFPVPSTSLFRN